MQIMDEDWNINPNTKVILNQFGLYAPQSVPAFVPLLVKILFTVPFWTTMRLYFRDRHYAGRAEVSKPTRYGTFATSSIESIIMNTCLVLD